jgi:hypothetical protein
VEAENLDFASFFFDFPSPGLDFPSLGLENPFPSRLDQKAGCYKDRKQRESRGARRF